MNREADLSIAFCRACSASVHNHGTKETGVCGLAKPPRTQAFPGQAWRSTRLVTIARKLQAGSTVHADEAAHWDALHARFLTKRINHSEAYSDGEACTNQAESFFSRLRRAEIGVHHHVAGPYLAAYASEMAWRENNRRISNGEQYLMTCDAALQHPVSRQWKRYWQR